LRLPARYGRCLAIALPAIVAASMPADVHAGAGYTADRPTVLVATGDRRIDIAATPDQGLYRADALPKVTIRSDAAAGAQLAWQVRDGFGSTLAEGARPADAARTTEIALPPGHGYYEVAATIRRGERVLGEARRSIGALDEPPAPAGDEPFGLWIQGSELYPELGVRWTREGIWWRGYANAGKRYLENRIALFDARYRAHGIRVIAYPKHPHPHQVSREVIADTPQAWRDLEIWWTEMVRTLAGHVDAWAVVNEPTGRTWKGDDELILRYWRLMRRIVDRHDPKTPLLGPSLNSDDPGQMAQYQRLLDRGFARYIDVVEMHTYTDTPEASWGKATRRIAGMTERADPRSLPIWSTEHGYTASYAEEPQQARLLARSMLEARRIGYPVVIWHMFGNPQGPDTRERQFSIFRGAPDGAAPPQPRPAGVAYGVMTRQLAGARYAGGVDGLPSAVESYVFAREGETMIALSNPDGAPATVTLPADTARPPVVTDLFGRRTTPVIRDGRITLTVGREPVYVAPFGDGGR
jgi:hypothetical protein